MPNFNVGAAPTQVYSAPTSATFNAPATVQLFNAGSSPVFIGNNGVSVSNGLQLNPGAHFRVVNMYTSLYACSGYATTAASTTTSAAVNAGATSLPITLGTGTVNGQYVVVGSGNNQEVVQIVSGGGTTTLTVTALNYDHKSGASVQAASAVGAQLNVIPGVV